MTKKKVMPELDRLRADKLKSQNELAKLTIERTRGALVAKGDVERRVFELARSLRDAWLSWPSRIAPIMAAKLNCDAHALQSELEAEVTRHLAELGEPKL